MTSPPAESRVSDALVSEAGAEAQRRNYGTIVIVGGGCYGSYYTRQLGRAARAGALDWESLVIVDRDEACAVKHSPDFIAMLDLPRPPRLVVAEWRDFFDHFLGTTAEREGISTDAIVPSPLMPHLLYEWLLNRSADRWPGRQVETLPLTVAPRIPWQRASPDGTHYVSFALWTCPINCIEPAICPHTRSERSWSMPPALEQYVAEATTNGQALQGPIVFHCTHRAYGVGMVDVADVVAADRLVAETGDRGPADFLVGTVSHCHGALNVLHLV